MNQAVWQSLLGVYAGVAAGYALGRLGWLQALWPRAAGDRWPAGFAEPVQALGQLAFFVFVPALLFRTTARLDLDRLPWTTLAAYFLPAVALLLGVYALSRWRGRAAAVPSTPGSGAAQGAAQAPAVRALTATFGNTAQLGIPVAAALFGEPGLALHLGVIALHALILMTLATVLAEIDGARGEARQAPAAAAARDRGAPRWRRLASVAGQTARRSLIHPVVLPVLAGLAWNAAGWHLPETIDSLLSAVSALAVPACLLLIGLSLAQARGSGVLQGALALVAIKLAAMPVLVALVARGLFGLQGLPLAVLVMAAALPAGANALLFAQRYRVLEAQTAAAVAGSTLLFALSAPLWITLLQRFA